MEGNFGIIHVAFCATCRVCLRDLAEQEWDLVPNSETCGPTPRKAARNRKVYYMVLSGCLRKDVAKQFGISSGRVTSIYNRETRLVGAEDSRKRMGLFDES